MESEAIYNASIMRLCDTRWSLPLRAGLYALLPGLPHISHEQVFCDVLALDGVASEIECIDKDMVKIMFRVCLYSTHQFIF